MVHVSSGEVRTIYRSSQGAHCGVATFNPVADEIIFLQGPANPTPDWSYGPNHRQGVRVALGAPGEAMHLDARDLTEPFTPGALRGGTHLHMFRSCGRWISFTYHDRLLAQRTTTTDADVDQRNVGVCVPGAVIVNKDHPRNHDGSHFSVLVTRTVAQPLPGSDQISKACEEAWVGERGYTHAGTRYPYALAFQGQVTTANGTSLAEVFIADLPEDLTKVGDGPLAGTTTRRPFPPRGVVQRRLTFTSERAYPGLQGPRHWLRSSPDGQHIAFLMKDDNGVVQLWTVPPWGGMPQQLTHNRWPIASAFTWSRDGNSIAHIMDNSVALTNSRTGDTRRLTQRFSDAEAPRPEACVFSPDGRRVCYIRRVPDEGRVSNQIFVTETSDNERSASAS